MASEASAEAPFLPVCVPDLGGNEERYVLEALRAGWISSVGPQVREFEERFAASVDRRHGIAVSSGTAALHVALGALDLGPGDEVLIPDFTMAAVLFSVLYTGATPVPVDAHSRSWNLDSDKLEGARTERTKALIAAHTYGRPCDMKAITAFAERHGIAVVEDAAEAHGARIGARPCGSFGRLSAFSFFANKIIATGEGGMVVTDDDALADRCRSLRNLGFPRSGPRDYWHEELGYNYRFTSLHAALGLAQLERLEPLSEARRENARRYTVRLERLPGLELPAEDPGTRHVHWMYGLLVDEKRFGLSRDALRTALRERAIDSRNFFRPMHRQSPYLEARPGVGGSFPVSVELSERGLYLPSSSGLTQSEVGRVCSAIEDIHRNARGASS